MLPWPLVAREARDLREPPLTLLTVPGPRTLPVVVLVALAAWAVIPALPAARQRDSHTKRAGGDTAIST